MLTALLTVLSTTLLMLYWCAAPLGEKSMDLRVLPAGVIYPLDWRSIKDKDTPLAKEKDFTICAVNAASFNAEKCKSYFPDAFAITWWTHSWTGERK